MNVDYTKPLAMKSTRYSYNYLSIYTTLFLKMERSVLWSKKEADPQSVYENID